MNSVEIWKSTLLAALLFEWVHSIASISKYSSINFFLSLTRLVISQKIGERSTIFDFDFDFFFVRRCLFVTKKAAAMMNIDINAVIDDINS